MKIKTSELTGDALDWAVAKAEGTTLTYYDASWWYQAIEIGLIPFSTDWSQGGPIIERERIAVWTPMTQFKKSEWEAGKSFIDADGTELEITQEFYGPTPLIAAMRCYVASKLGDEVEIPEELK